MSGGSTGKRLADYLGHIEQAATDACSFVAGRDEGQFVSDKRTQSAVIMSLVVIGEASTRRDGSVGKSDEPKGPN